jgi:preprotein translocase subunit SecG
MPTILTVIHIAVCIFLVVIVLLQQGKGANMGATFGGSSQTVFGSEVPLPLLNKVTTIAAVTFMVTSISLAYISAHKSTSSVMKDFSEQQPQGSGIERSAEPLPKTDMPDMPLTPAEPAVPAAPAASATPKVSDQKGAVPDMGSKAAQTATPQQAVQAPEQKKVEAPVGQEKKETTAK